jgi:SAM-dependent methyltransferase
MFQRLYDILMEDIDYEKIYQDIKPYIKNTDLIIDAGCGSGYFLLELLKNNHQAIGIDIDSMMLSIAQEKIKSNHLTPILYEHDLRDPLYSKVDLIIMIFDVVNYFKGVKKLFSNIYKSLDNDGRFIFDIYKYEVLDSYKNFIEIDDEIVSYKWEVKVSNQVLNHFVTFENEVDHIKQYIYPLSYYLDILNELNFKVEVINGTDFRKHYIICYK